MSATKSTSALIPPRTSRLGLEFKGTFERTFEHVVARGTRLYSGDEYEPREKDYVAPINVYCWGVWIEQRRLIKVGVTRDMHRRFATFRRGLPPIAYASVLDSVEMLSGARALRIERDIFSACHEFRIGGEWLELPAGLIGPVMKSRWPCKSDKFRARTATTGLR